MFYLLIYALGLTISLRMIGGGSGCFCKGNPCGNPFPISSYGIRTLSGRPVLFPSGLPPGSSGFVRIPVVCTQVHCLSHSTSRLGSIWRSDVCILTVVYIAVLWHGDYLRFDLLGSPLRQVCTTVVSGHYIYLGSPSASASGSGYLRRGCPYSFSIQ